MGQKKPHLLHVEFDIGGSFRILQYKIECPNESEGIARDCSSWVECSEGDAECVDHLPPKQPDVPEPDLKWRGGERVVPEDTDPAHVKAWDEYYEAHEDWYGEREHPGYHQTDECWLKDYVNEGYEDGFELSREFDGVPVASPLKVFWVNSGGGIDDSYVELYPWEEVSDGKEANHPGHE